MQSENIYWVWLSTRLGVACEDFALLMQQYDNPYDIYSASSEELSSIEGIGETTIAALADKKLKEAAEIVEFCYKTDVRMISYTNKEYPNRLRLIKDPPVLLYVRGTLPNMDSRVCIAMVGTRRMSEYGRSCAYKIAYELGAAGAVVVSGMALGIDGVSAGGAIMGGGKTVAVLGCGIDVVYPREHVRLRNIIVQNGAVVTEYAPGTSPAGENFPKRNRIISGMCQGTLIVEADMRSGAMITARAAISQGRQLFAIPGNLGEENTAGTNILIRDGAIIVTESKDILREYHNLYGRVIDTARLLSAKRKYIFSEDALRRMGISSRTVSRVEYPTNKPSAPRSEFEMRPSYISSDGSCNSESVSTLGIMRTSPPVSQAKGDNSDALLGALTDRQRAMFAEMPDDRAITLDALTKIGFSIGEVMTGMTVLEISGLINSLPGGLYIKK